MISSGLNTLYIMVGQAGVFGSPSPTGAVYWGSTLNFYTTFGGGGSCGKSENKFYNGWGGGASAIAIGPPGLSLNGLTFWTNTQIKLLAVAGYYY